MKRFACLSIFLMVLGIFLAGSAQADLIVSWDMYGVGTVDTVASNQSVAEVTGFDMSMGDGLTAYDASNSFNTSGWNGSDAGDYIQIGFSVMDGYEISLDELWLGTRSSNTGPGTIGVYTSLDGYSTALTEITQEGSAYSNSIVDLSILSAVSGDFYLRLYEIGDTQADGDGITAGTGTFRISDYYDGDYTDVQITGTPSPTVPVPGALWLLGSGLLGVVGLRRKMA